MASIEFITKRIEGKQKEIDKLQKKLARIEKAEASGWEDNPYYYSESDKRWALRDLEAAKESLTKYQKELVTANEKAASRDVKAILDFLENWKARCKEFYESSFLKYKIAYAEWREEDNKYCEWANHGGWKDPNREAIRKAHDEKRKEFYSGWAFLTRYITRELNQERTHYEEVLDRAKISKELDEDAKAKYDDIIQRTNEITGKITDASYLSVGEKGELNGYIIGERGTAKVHTIGAGGYNIQCFHFRTLVHKA